MIALSIAKLKMFSRESKIFLWIKPKKKKKLFSGKFGSMPTFRSKQKGRKYLWWAYVCLITRLNKTLHLHQVFFDFTRISYFKFLEFKEFNKLINYYLINYYSIRACWIWDWLQPTQRYVPRWLFTISHPTRAHGMIVNFFFLRS